MTLYMLLAGLAGLTYVGGAALTAVPGPTDHRAAVGDDFAFLASLSVLLVATVLFATRSARATVLIVAVMCAGAVAMMFVAARAPSVAPTKTNMRQHPVAECGGLQLAREAALGEQLFKELGCNGCHRPDGNGVGPALAGGFGRPLAEPGCGLLIADEDYVRESIVNPAAVVASGFAPIMPSFAGRVTEGQLRALIAYLKSPCLQ